MGALGPLITQGALRSLAHLGALEFLVALVLRVPET